MMLSRPLEISDSTTRIFAGRYSNLANIGEFVRSQARLSGLDDTAVYQVEMAVDEACSNIIEHAYGAEDIGEIDCTCQRQADGLRIILKDTGKPFHPDEVGWPNLQAGIEDRAAHGLGLFFIREWMDRVDFQFLPGAGNVLTLFKDRAGKKPAKKK
jgi:serine/threonine-protein kinase RsbW